MKKMILILILVIPVMIALVITLLAGFVAREVAFVKIESVEIPLSLEQKLRTELKEYAGEGNLFWETDDHSTWTIGKIILDKDFPIKDFMVLEPKGKAKFAFLDCRYKVNGREIANKDDVPVIIDKYGYLHGQHESDQETTIEIMVGTSIELTFIIEKVVK